jgi:hypothetical protein
MTQNPAAKQGRRHRFASNESDPLNTISGMKARNHFRFPPKIPQTEINDNKAIIPSPISNCIGIQGGVSQFVIHQPEREALHPLASPCLQANRKENRLQL